MTNKMCLPHTNKDEKLAMDGSNTSTYLAAMTLAFAASTSSSRSRSCCGKCGGGHLCAYVFTWTIDADKVYNGQDVKVFASVCAITPAFVLAS